VATCNLSSRWRARQYRSNPAPSGLSIAYSSQSGNTVVAVCALGNTTSSVAKITDSGSSWTLQAAVNNGTALRTEIWSTSAKGSVASQSFKYQYFGPNPASCAIEEYAGVQNLGTAATAQATSGNWSVSLATQDPNDYVVAGIGANSYYRYTTISGTTRQLGGLTSNAGNDYVSRSLCVTTQLQRLPSFPVQLFQDRRHGPPLTRTPVAAVNFNELQRWLSR